MDYIRKNKELWDEHFANTMLDYPNEDVIRFLAKCKTLYPNGKMLDWGCATGRHTVLGCRFGFDVIAADYVERCVDITKQKVISECEGAKGKVLDYIVNNDLDVEKVQDATLDIILMWGVAFYNTIANQRIMLGNAYRMLKKGGRVFIDFRTQRDSICEAERVKEGNLLITGESKHLEGFTMNIQSLESLQDMLGSVGFKVENVELYEFTQNNQEIRNSWWHMTLLK